MPFLSLFPLRLVAFPGENLNLHIFEPRYRQLIGECLAEHTTFGLPAYIDDKLPGYGTEMEITQLAKAYSDGRYDIRTRGLRVFRMLEFENPAPGKLYARATVEFMPEPEIAPAVRADLLQAVEALYHLLKITMPHLDPELRQPYSYQIAHGVGLPPEGEYELLTLPTEFERQEFLLAHLQRMLPMMENIERSKEMVRMNGEFRKFGEELEL